MDTDFEPSSSSLVAAILRKLEHEDTLMVNRLSWMVASQSFLFTAYAIVSNGASAAQNTALAASHNPLQGLLPALGLATCGLIYVGVLTGVRVSWGLRRRLWQLWGGTDGGWELIVGTDAAHVLGAVAPMCLPPVFLGAWALLLWWVR